MNDATSGVSDTNDRLSRHPAYRLDTIFLVSAPRYNLPFTSGRIQNVRCRYVSLPPPRERESIRYIVTPRRVYTNEISPRDAIRRTDTPVRPSRDNRVIDIGRERGTITEKRTTTIRNPTPQTFGRLEHPRGGDNRKLLYTIISFNRGSVGGRGQLNLIYGRKRKTTRLIGRTEYLIPAPTRRALALPVGYADLKASLRGTRAHAHLGERLSVRREFEVSSSAESRVGSSNIYGMYAFRAFSRLDVDGYASCADLTAFNESSLLRTP